jgi:hypothetical protein
MTKNIYVEEGYKDRADYLRNLAWDNDVDEDVVFALADVLGEGEDFDGLVTSIEDIAMGCYY